MPESTPDTESVFATLRNIIVESTGYDSEDISMESDIVRELAIDSLSIVEISVRAEDSFGVHINDEVAADFRTVGDVVRFIQAAL